MERCCYGAVLKGRYFVIVLEGFCSEIVMVEMLFEVVVGTSSFPAAMGGNFH